MSYCICVPNFRVIPENKFVLLTPKVGRPRPFENVRNKNRCVVLSTGKVELSFGFNDTI